VVRQLYDTGLYYIALGTTTDEAFGPFLRARARFWSLPLCRSEIYSVGQILILTRTPVSCDIYEVKLVASFRTKAQRKGSSDANEDGRPLANYTFRAQGGGGYPQSINSCRLSPRQRLRQNLFCHGDAEIFGSLYSRRLRQ
jgi:hypothetical protein